MEVVLKQLVADGHLVLKEYSKAKLYLLNQSIFPEVKPEEMESLNQKLGELKENFKDLNAEQKALNTQFKELQGQKTNEELEKEILLLEKKVLLLKKIKDAELIYIFINLI